MLCLHPRQSLFLTQGKTGHNPPRPSQRKASSAKNSSLECLWFGETHLEHCWCWQASQPSQPQPGSSVSSNAQLVFASYPPKPDLQQQGILSLPMSKTGFARSHTAQMGVASDSFPPRSVCEVRPAQGQGAPSKEKQLVEVLPPVPFRSNFPKVPLRANLPKVLPQSSKHRRC